MMVRMLMTRRVRMLMTYDEDDEDDSSGWLE